MKTKLASVGLAFDENQGVRTLHLQPLIKQMRSDSHVILEKKENGRNEMVISIDYLCSYDPVVFSCILKSTQIIGFTNFVFRVITSPLGSKEIIAKGNRASFCAEA